MRNSFCILLHLHGSWFVLKKQNKKKTKEKTNPSKWKRETRTWSEKRTMQTRYMNFKTYLLTALTPLHNKTSSDIGNIRVKHYFHGWRRRTKLFRQDVSTKSSQLSQCNGKLMKFVKCQWKNQSNKCKKIKRCTFAKWNGEHFRVYSNPNFKCRLKHQVFCYKFYSHATAKDLKRNILIWVLSQQTTVLKIFLKFLFQKLN